MVQVPRTPHDHSAVQPDKSAKSANLTWPRGLSGGSSRRLAPRPSVGGGSAPVPARGGSRLSSVAALSIQGVRSRDLSASTSGTPELVLPDVSGGVMLLPIGLNDQRQRAIEERPYIDPLIATSTANA
jgi:hypothetical protein